MFEEKIEANFDTKELTTITNIEDIDNTKERFYEYVKYVCHKNELLAECLYYFSLVDDNPPLSLKKRIEDHLKIKIG